jgi:hypothetical protein
MNRRAIIRDRKFWWLYPDTGRMERIYSTERVRSQLSQVASTEAREKPKVRTNPPRPPGTHPTLPAATYDGTLTLKELGHIHGWGSPSRFRDALRKHRPAILEAARARRERKAT